MARNTSIILGDNFEQFVDQQVNAGHYHSASEVIRAGLRLLQEHELKMTRLRAEIGKGWEEAERGEFADFDQEAIREQLDQECSE